VSSVNYLKLEKSFDLGVNIKKDLVLVRGKNARVWDDHGREYIDCVGGLGVASIGHANTELCKAIQKQCQRLLSCSNLFHNDVRARLLQKLISITPSNLTRAFLCNSGTESVEAAIKLARFTTQKTEFICAEYGYHGRTLGALSATYKPEYRNDFKPLVPGFHFVPFNHFKKLKAKVSDHTAAIILEIVQGEGGVRLGDHEFFIQVRRLCDEKNVLLILDEVQTGFCRTGQFFACNHFNLEPDILCVAKAMAGGLPMGGVICSDKIKPPVGRHGSTFGANPLACAASLATIQFMIDHRLDVESAKKGDYLANRLKSSSSDDIVEIRHLGLMMGIEMNIQVAPLIQELQERGLLVLSSGSSVLRLLPPLTISYEELEQVAEILTEVLSPSDREN
jgi:acetylornithine/LysW-gamma-L-lysine aminotransferase